MNTRYLVIGAVVLAGSLGTAAPTEWFGMDFAGYAEGAFLSEAGTVGGGWGNSSALVRAVDSEKGAMVSNYEHRVTFTAAETSDRTFVSSEYRFRADEIGDVDTVPGCGDSFGGFSLLADEDGEISFYGVGKDGWVALSAPGIVPAAQTWYDLRIEVRVAGGRRRIRYSIRQGGEWRPLADADGLAWQLVDAAETTGLSSVTACGAGLLSNFSAAQDDAVTAGEYYWIGEKNGDWSAAANWSLTEGGEPAEGAPHAVGDTAIVYGKATVKVDGVEVGLKNVNVTFVDDGTGNPAGRVTAGKVDLSATYTLDDATRPRVGKRLSFAHGSFYDYTPTFTTAWYRGDFSPLSGIGGSSPAAAFPTAVFEDEPFSTAADYTPTEADYERWLRFVAYEDGRPAFTKDILFSDLPVFYIDTDDGKEPTSAKEEHDATLFMQGNGTFKSQYDGVATVKVRGNSTKGYPKKPWKLKLDKKTNLCDLNAKSKHWVLLANWNDMSQMRNKLAADFANAIGGLGMRSTWVGVVFNGVYRGVYQLSEHVRVAEERINVYDWAGVGEEIADAIAAAEGLSKNDKKALEAWSETNLSWTTSGKMSLKGVDYDCRTYYPDYTNDITGGYVWEFDQFAGGTFNGGSVSDEVSSFSKLATGTLELAGAVNSPEYAVSNPEMFAWCTNFVCTYFSCFTSGRGYSAEGLHYTAYCDIDSMVAYFLVNELFGNVDAAKNSRYAYKDIGKKLRFGPVWDFDWGSASVTVDPHANYGGATAWQCARTGYDEQFFREWTADPYFCTRLYERYWEVRSTYTNAVCAGGLVDSYADTLRRAGAAHDRLWTQTRGSGSANVYRTFAEDQAILKEYFRRRLVWLDAQFASVPTLMDSLKDAKATKPYEANVSSLPIAFANAADGIACDGQSLIMKFTIPADRRSGVETLDVYVNGLACGDRLAVPASGEVELTIPNERFTEPKGRYNCISLVGNVAGTLNMRNYALVKFEDWPAEARTDAETDPATGDRVPSVPFKWVIDNAAVRRPDVRLMTEKSEFAAVLKTVPSPWGKSAPLWHDYVAGTNPDPNGTNAVLKITATGENGLPAAWTPDLGASRVYTIKGKASLSDPAETWHDRTSDDRFFKVTVEMPAE